MAKSLFLVASLLLLLPPSPAAEATEPKTVAGKQPGLGPGSCEPIANINDPCIQSLGKFAVEEHNNKSHTHLQFVEVVCGCYQIVSGISYTLCLKAIDENEIVGLYVAVVYEDLNKKLYLIDFYKTLYCLLHAEA